MDKALADSKATGYRLFILAVSVLSLLVIAAMMLVPMDEQTYRLMGLARSDREHPECGCVPLGAGGAIGAGGAAAAWGGVRSGRHLLRILGHYRRRSAAAVSAMIAFLAVTIGSMGILHFELGVEDSNIRTAEDAIWWAWVTITTVGYGDYAPVTTGGRIVAMVLMVVGVGLFSSMSGLVASWLLQPSADSGGEQSDG